MNTAATKRVDIAWPEHHIVWVEAAMTLPRSERTAAYKDIAAMTGRTLSAVRCKAYWLEEQRHEQALRARTMIKFSEGVARQPFVVAGTLGTLRRKLENSPSEIKPLSKARLMGCR